MATTQGRFKVELRKRGKKSRRFKQSRYPQFRYVATGKYAYHFEARNLTPHEVHVLRKLAKDDYYDIRVINEKDIRGTSYRRDYLNTHEAPYRCVYCNKKLELETLTVDHLVPVAAAKTQSGQRKLKLIKANSVNDLPNLVAACSSCNLKKGTKMGRWYLRGILGQHRLYWLVRNTVYVAVAVLLVIVAVLLVILAINYMKLGYMLSFE